MALCCIILNKLDILFAAVVGRVRVRDLFSAITLAHAQFASRALWTFPVT